MAVITITRQDKESFDYVKLKRAMPRRRLIEPLLLV
jgi:hypothetical protein